MKKIFILLAIGFVLANCQYKSTKEVRAAIKAEAFDTLFNNQKISLYTLTNQNGFKMQVTNFGAHIVTLFTPDKNGHFEDVVLGYENINRYLNNTGPRYMGATIGRFAGRIANGQFTMDGINYQLTANKNGHCLHGGNVGFDMVVWKVIGQTENSIKLSYTSKDGEEGFPGTVEVILTYILTHDNTVFIEYKATTDKKTVVNFTNHTFFNLKGEGNGTITDHILYVNADKYTPVDSLQIPTGAMDVVDNTPFDFRKPTKIAKRIDDKHPQIMMAKGYDVNYVLNRKTANGEEYVASVYEPESGRFMEVFTSEPGLQLYTANFFDGKTLGKYGESLKSREAFAMETQHFPDSPNHPNFPSTVLEAGNTYKQICIYRFSVR